MLSLKSVRFIFLDIFILTSILFIKQNLETMHEGGTFSYSPEMVYKEIRNVVWKEVLSKLLSVYGLCFWLVAITFGWAIFPMEWNVIPIMFLITPIVVVIAVFFLCAKVMYFIFPHTVVGEKWVVGYLNTEIKKWEDASVSEENQRNGYWMDCEERVQIYRIVRQEFLDFA